MSDQRERDGVWIARYPDGSAIVPFGEEINALRYAVDNSMRVAWVPFGEDARTYEDEREGKAS